MCMIFFIYLHSLDKWTCSSTIVDLGSGRRWLVTMTLRALYSQGKSPRTPWAEGWVVGLSLYWRCKAGEANLLPCWELNPSRPESSPPLYRLGYKMFIWGWTNWVMERMRWWSDIVTRGVTRLEWALRGVNYVESWGLWSSSNLSFEELTRLQWAVRWEYSYNDEHCGLLSNINCWKSEWRFQMAVREENYLKMKFVIYSAIAS
jgi:hypothetical protein